MTNISPPSTQLTTLRLRPRIAITMGDPAGIGPEVVLKALANPDLTQVADITVVGDRSLLLEQYHRLRQGLGQTQRHTPLANPAELSVLDLPLESAIKQPIIIGRGNAVSGAASFKYLKAAIAETLSSAFDGIVTAPIAKSAWKAAGHIYPGQTELLAESAGSRQFGMLFVARSPHSGWILRTLLATTHIPLKQVPDALSPDLLTNKLALLIESLERDFGLKTPRIAIAGLNPHSGEQGQLGEEEQAWLIPCLEAQRSRYSQVTLDGPIPPDTLWVQPGQAWYGLGDRVAEDKRTYDAYLALYHDQGLIPVKLMAFDQAINTTIGLPFIRTSPDHGTAFDIAGKGVAQSKSMEAAIQLAIDLTERRLCENQSSGKGSNPI